MSENDETPSGCLYTLASICLLFSACSAGCGYMIGTSKEIPHQDRFILYKLSAWGLGLCFLFGIIGTITRQIRDGNRRRAEERERQAGAEQKRIREKAEHEAEQRRLSSNLSQYIADSDQNLSAIAQSIQKTENQLNRAEHEFEEGAFAPFWDAIEQVAAGLAQIDRAVIKIASAFESYKKDSLGLDSRPPPFTLDLAALPRPTELADRMNILVRKAQKDFQFSSIYEQRRTNKILIAGFSNLGEAINQMSDRLDSSLVALSDSLHSYLIENQNRSDQVIGEMQNLQSSIKEESAARRDHEKRQLEILENIQRRRRKR